jgi:hypothetical protein
MAEVPYSSDRLNDAARTGDAFKPGPVLLLMLSVFLGLTGCGNESATVRYRATAKVVVDGKLYEGSTVRETGFTETPHSLTGFAMSVTDKGEAIAVDSGGHGSAVYLLLNDDSGSAEFPHIVLRCFGITEDAAGSGWTAKLKNIPVQQKCTLTPGKFDKIMPLVVSFQDEAVPKSIFEVTPESYREAFGVEARFVELQLERVDDSAQLDGDIDKRLPWLNQIPFGGSHIRVLDPSGNRNVPRDQFTLAQRATGYYFKD